MDKRASKALAAAILALRRIPKKDLNTVSLADAAHTLSALPEMAELGEIKKSISRRLQTQLSATWIKSGNAYDVFCVLSALWQHEPASVTGEHLAAALQRLIAAELVVGGPYHFEAAVTIPANVQIAIFMRHVAKPLPNVDAFLARVIEGRFKDMHIDDRTLLYLLAHAGGIPKLTTYVERNWTLASWQTPLGIATALTVMRYTLPAYQIQRAIKTLCNQQQNGFWQESPVSERYVTTAVVASTLASFQPRISVNTSRLRSHQQVITRAAQQMFAVCAEPLRSSAIASINRVGAADKNFEITLLSQLFAKALKTPDTLTAEQHKELGLASLYGWIAYTIYDDFLDDKGLPAKLPVANIAMRASLDCFRAALPKHEAFVRYVAKIFSTMDEANAWEVRHCRFVVNGGEITIRQLPKYGGRTLLAARSLAHSLTPLAVLEQCLTCNKQRSRHIKTAFTHYLIARQLSDDLQDWTEDILKGQASYVVTAILRDLSVKPDTYHLAELLPRMQKRFRRAILPKVCRHITQHIAKSRAAFQNSQLLHKNSDFYALLDRLEFTAQHSLDGHTKAVAFYKASKKIIY